MENTVFANNKPFVFITENETSLGVNLVKSENGVDIYKITLKALDGEYLKPVLIRWKEQLKGILSIWNPTMDREKFIPQRFRRHLFESNFYKGVPLISLLDEDGKNYQTVCVSEAHFSVRLEVFVDDFNQSEEFGIECLLLNGEEKLTHFETFIRLDNNTEKDFDDAIKEASHYLQSFYPNSNPRTIAGEMPLYSTWYNYHQHPNSFSLDKELEIASSLGFKHMIIDDGWSYDGNGDGSYGNCGDWTIATSKFPDFKAFVKKAHDLDIKISVWFPIPFVGYRSNDFAKMKQYMYAGSDGCSTGLIDPRYPESRKYIVDSYMDMVEKYDIDGLKLDFIDFYMADNLTFDGYSTAPGKDCERIEQGLVKLLDEIFKTFNAVKPDFMIEFRQYYIGASITRFCNLLRVFDCVFDSHSNRIGITDLRLLDYNLAVHADMLFWAKNETPENCALQMLNIMFGVPQISVILNEVPASHRDAIKAFIEYWTINKELILHGNFKVKDNFNNYTLLSSEDDNKKIAVNYSGNSYVFDGKATDLFNATKETNYFIQNLTDKCATLTIFDYLNNKIEEVKLNANSVGAIKAPIACRIEIR